MCGIQSESRYRYPRRAARPFTFPKVGMAFLVLRHSRKGYEVVAATGPVPQLDQVTTRASCTPPAFNA